ncbi:hypothetical protein ACFQDR_13015 [Sulfitobacter sediminilitoris]
MREREAASREILQVISRSRDDSLPVFDTILAHARRLCDSLHAGLFLVSEDKSELQLAAYQGEDEWLVALHFQNPPKLEDIGIQWFKPQSPGLSSTSKTLRQMNWAQVQEQQEVFFTYHCSRGMNVMVF